jgi:hypothetical protein
MEHITFVNKGLGEVKKTCGVISGFENKGDGHISCPVTAGGPIPAPEGYAVRNTLDLVRLDEYLLNEEIYLLKIDVYVTLFFNSLSAKDLNITF